MKCVALHIQIGATRKTVGSSWSYNSRNDSPRKTSIFRLVGSTRKSVLHAAKRTKRVGNHEFTGTFLEIENPTVNFSNVYGYFWQIRKSYRKFLKRLRVLLAKSKILQ